MSKKKWGGRREGAGRPPKHGKAMKQKTIRLPEHWIADLVEKFGSLQVAIESLVSDYLNDR